MLIAARWTHAYLSTANKLNQNIQEINEFICEYEYEWEWGPPPPHPILCDDFVSK